MKKVLCFILFAFLGINSVYANSKTDYSCSWLINEENSEWLYYSLGIEGKEAYLNFYYDGKDNYSFSFEGLNSDYSIEKSGFVDKNKTLYEIEVYPGESGDYTRLQFRFDGKTLVGNFNNTCPYNSLYYKTTNDTIRTYEFSTGVFDPAIKQYIVDISNKQEDPKDEVWCSHKYTLVGQYDTKKFRIYYWNSPEGIKYAIRDNNIEESKFDYTYDWHTVNEDVLVAGTTFNDVLIEFKDIGGVAYLESDGNLVCPPDFESKSETMMPSDEYSDLSVLISTSHKYKELIKDLQPYVEKVAENKQVDIEGRLELKIDDELLKFPWIEEIKPVSNSNLEYMMTQKIYDVKEYCNYIIKNFKQIDHDNYTKRLTECAYFNQVVKEMVKLNLLSDPSSGCDFVTDELKDKIIWILDLIKIAGPIAALGLGTLDFIKAIASGDADKEMKTAFKRFSTRLIAAALLFLVPIIVAFLLDTFLGNQDGYNTDNPFCNVVDWKE